MFTQKTWVDGPGGGTPVTAAELNRMEQGITDATNEVLISPTLPSVTTRGLYIQTDPVTGALMDIFFEDGMG